MGSDSDPSPVTSAHADRAGTIRRRLAWARRGTRIVPLVVLVALVFVLRALVVDGVNWAYYAGSLAAVILLFHIVSVDRVIRWRDQFIVGAVGDAWTLGRYSEADIRAIVQDVTALLPGRWPRFRVVVSSDRETNAATWFDTLWPPFSGWHVAVRRRGRGRR